MRRRPDDISRVAITNGWIVYILRRDRFLRSPLGAHAAPSQPLAHTMIGGVQLLQQSPRPVPTKYRESLKEVPCALHSWQPGDVSPWSAVGKTQNRLQQQAGGQQAAVANTSSAYERFLRVGYAFPTRTHPVSAIVILGLLVRSSGMACENNGDSMLQQ